MPEDAFTRELLRRLDSGDAVEREAARKELAAIAGYLRQPEMLKRMSDASDDPVIKQAIAARTEAVAAEEALDKMMHTPLLSVRSLMDGACLRR